jgi:hypothetical protein
MSDQSNRYSREILNPQSLRVIANTISETIQRTLTNTEIADLFSYVKFRSTQNWVGMTPQKIRQNIVRNFVESRFTAKGRESTQDKNDLVDIHEILKGHIGTSDQEPNYDATDNVDHNGIPIDDSVSMQDAHTSRPASGKVSLGSLDNINVINKIMQVTALDNIKGIFGKTDETSFQQMVNPQAAWRKNYIILDSFYRDTSGDSPGSGITNFQWNFLANSGTNTPGAVNSLGNVEQLVAMQCPNIRIPFQNNAMVNAYKRISMVINEFSGQSYIGQEGRKFHFLFSTELDINMIECKALFNEISTFEFAKPITQIDTLTVSFGCPLETITFDMDRALMNITYNSQARLTSTFRHKLQTGDQVYIKNFTTNDPSTDFAIIADAKRPQGYNIFVIDDYTIDLPDLNLSGIASPINPYTVQVLFGSKRLFVPIELKYVKSAEPVKKI